MTQEVKYTIQSLKNLHEFNDTAKLAVVVFGNTPETNVMIDTIRSMAKEWKVSVEVVSINEDAEMLTINGYLYDLYCDKTLDGVAILPPYSKLLTNENVTSIINRIRPEENVCGYIQNNRTYYLPVREEGIVRFLNQVTSVKGKFITILVDTYDNGQILSHLLNRLGATTCVISDTSTYVLCESLVKQSDVVVSALNTPYFLNQNMIKDGAIVIDCGMKLVNGKPMSDMKPYDKANVNFYCTETNEINELAVAVMLSNVRKTHSKFGRE